MKIFMHRNGQGVCYNGDKLQLKDLVTGKTYLLNSLFYSINSPQDKREYGRISVLPTRETASIMVSENNEDHTLNYYMTTQIQEFSERFEPVDILVNDWFTFNHNGQSFVGQLQDQILSTTTLYRLRTADGTIYNMPVNECTFYATREVNEDTVHNINLRIPQLNDMVCLKSDVTKIGKVKELNWRNKFVVVDYFDHTQFVGEADANELTVLSKEQEVRWGSFSGPIENGTNPRVREGIDEGTHQVFRLIRNGTEMRCINTRGYSVNTLGIPLVMKQYCPQLGRSVETKRFKDGEWMIDITVEDHMTPQGTVVKTWYKALDHRNRAHEEWLMRAMYNYKVLYNTLISSMSTANTLEGIMTPEQVEEAAELLTATQRIENAAARYRTEASVREAARVEESRRQEAARLEQQVIENARLETERRLREAEEAKRSIWGYHILKPKVQNP